MWSVDGWVREKEIEGGGIRSGGRGGGGEVIQEVVWRRSVIWSFSMRQEEWEAHAAKEAIMKRASLSETTLQYVIWNTEALNGSSFLTRTRSKAGDALPCWITSPCVCVGWRITPTRPGSRSRRSDPCPDFSPRSGPKSRRIMRATRLTGKLAPSRARGVPSYGQGLRSTFGRSVDTLVYIINIAIRKHEREIFK